MIQRQALTSGQQRLARDALGLVQRVARQVARRFPRAQYDDLVSVGQEALIDAARTFDPARDVPFEGFAYIRVHGEMLEHGIREATPLSVRLERALVVAHAPVVDDEPHAVDTEVDDFAEAQTWSLDRATSLAVAYLLSTPPEDPESAVSGARDRAKATGALSAAIATLPAGDAELTHLHYVEGLPLGQIAERRGVAERTVQRHHRRILEALRRVLRP